VPELVLEAAEKMADPRLYPALLELGHRRTCDREELTAAIAACRPADTEVMMFERKKHDT